MDMILNESEQAKNELMHFGMRGMRWGVRKAGVRAGLATGGKGVLPGSKAVQKSAKIKRQKAEDRYDKEYNTAVNRYVSATRTLNKTYKEIERGPGSRLSKLSAKMKASKEIDKKYQEALNKHETKYIMREANRNKVVKAKQDELSRSLQSKMEAEIKEVRSKGSITEKIFAPAQIEVKYHGLLAEGMAKIDEEED
jgi:hypothetical protein